MSSSADADTNEELSRSAVQPLSTPPAKRLRSSHGAREVIGADPMATSALTSASPLPLELWIAIGQMISNPHTLSSLVKVSRAFCAMFTPFLYAQRVINIERFSNPMDKTPLPPHLEYVQDFQINIFEFLSSSRQFPENRTEEFALWISRALKSMKCLHSFSWNDMSFDDLYNPALVLKNHRVLKALKNIKTLRHIFIRFAAQFIYDHRAVRKCWIPLKGFQGLTSLELYDVCRDHDRYIAELTDVLCKSPFLKKLGLGFASEIQHDDEAILFGSPNISVDFFECLCNFYGARSEGGPLALETLRLGNGVFLNEPVNASTSHYLTKLLIIESLEILHLYNGLVEPDDDITEPFYIAIDWTPFTRERCKSIRQLSVTRISLETAHWLRESGTCVTELIVTDHYSVSDAGLDAFYYLPSHLLMICTSEKYPSSRSSESEDEWTDIDSDSDEPDAESVESHSASDSNSSPEDFPTSTELALNKTVMTVLDRLPSGGSHLLRLSMAFDFETQLMQFSSHLPMLTCLTHLHLKPKSCRGGAFPTRASSLWPDAKDTAEIARRFAILICSMCPTLQYIMIGYDFAFQVVMSTGSDRNIKRHVNSARAFTLRELDRHDRLQVDIFAMSTFADVCGLPGPESYRDENDEKIDFEELNKVLTARGLPLLPV